MRPYFFSLFIIMMFLNCSSKKSEEKHKAENDVPIADTTYIDIIMENDTLGTKQEKGIIKYFYKLNDTIKLAPNDERRVYVTLALTAIGKNKEKFGVGKKIEKLLHFSPVNTYDTILIPITIKPYFPSGKGVIVAVLDDTYTLHSYDEEKVRILTYESIIKKNVYIKGHKSD